MYVLIFLLSFLSFLCWQLLGSCTLNCHSGDSGFCVHTSFLYLFLFSPVVIVPLSASLHMAFLTTLHRRFHPALLCSGHLRPEDLYAWWCDLSALARLMLSSESGWREAGAICYSCLSGTWQWCGRLLTHTGPSPINASVFVNTCLLGSSLGLQSSLCTAYQRDSRW